MKIDEYLRTASFKSILLILMEKKSVVVDMLDFYHYCYNIIIIIALRPILPRIS